MQSRRPPAVLQLEELNEQLNTRLEQVDAVLETLAMLLAKGEPPGDFFSRLHLAAVRDGRLADLAFAYEQITQERRVRALSAEAQSILYGNAAEFYDELFGDREAALNWAEKALFTVPNSEPNYTRIERWLSGSVYFARMARARIAVAKFIPDVDERRTWIGLALRDLSSEGNAASAIEVLESITQLDPDEAEAAAALEYRLLEVGRFRDAARRMEARLATEQLSPTEAHRIRERLLALYTNEMADPFKAIGQVESLLSIDPGNAAALVAAEKLASVASVAPRALSALADAQYALGNLDRAAALLSHELKIARGPRRQEVQGKLAILRQDILGDSAGALELLGPVVAVDPSRDDFRERFVRLSLQLNRTNDAARLLGRALQTVKEPILRSRISCDMGTVLLQSGEVRRARACLEEVIRADNDVQSVLKAARFLSDIYQQAGETKLLAEVLELVVVHETEPSLRETAAYQLTQLCQPGTEDERRAIIAWRALINSAHADEALALLKSHYESSGDALELANILEHMASRSVDIDEQRSLYWRVAELRSNVTKDKNALISLWQGLILHGGATREALDRLIPLLEAESRGFELAQALLQRIELSAEAERAELLARLGHVRLSILGDPEGALNCHANAIQLDPSLQLSRSDLELLLSVPLCRATAAVLLEPLLRADPPNNALLMALAARAESSQELDIRFAYYAEAVHLAVELLGQPEWGLRLSSLALRDSLDLNLESVDQWVQACARLQGSVTASERVICFEEILGERPFDRSQLRQLAVMTSDALLELGDARKAEALLRRALEYDASSPELLMRLDEILASQASPEERLNLYNDALNRSELPERKRDLYARIGSLLQRELNRPSEAIEAWNQVLVFDPQHLSAHQALLSLYSELGDSDAVARELERGLSVATGERRQRILERLAEVEELRSNLPEALARAQESLQLGPMDPEHLLRVQNLAERVGDLEVVQSLLEQRVPVASSEQDRADILAALAEVQVKRELSTEAIQVLHDAAALAGKIGDRIREQKLLERARELNSENLQTLERLVEFYAADGSTDRLNNLIEPWLIAGADERDVVRVIVDLESSSRASVAARDFASLCETAALLVKDAGRMRAVGLCSARVLAASGEAKLSAQVYRNLIAAQKTIDRDVLTAYTNLLNSVIDEPSWRDEWRWLFEQRYEKTQDKAVVLMEWATMEEQRHADYAAALSVYERLLEMDPKREEALLEIARLREQQGDAQGTLNALEQLVSLAANDARGSLVVRQAQLLVGPLGRAVEALDRIEPVIAEHPADPNVLAVVRSALEVPEARARAAELLQRVVVAVADPAEQAEVLESLLEVTHGATGFDSARAQWTLMLLDIRPDSDETSLVVVLREALRMKGQDDLWDRAEKIARRLGDPSAVLAAYRQALDESDAPDLAEQVGRRLVEFQEEWSEDLTDTLPLLQRIFERCKDAIWAFDRLKLAYNASGRWSDLFNLYDHAIERSSDNDERCELLREAAMAAKDFANDAERAIDYFSRLDSLHPNDARVEAALERLYERKELIRPLIDLLARQMKRTSDGLLQFPFAVRITSYWLDIGEALPAFELLEGLLKEFSDTNEVVGLLERLVALPAARDSFPPPATMTKKEKKEKARALTIRDRSALRLRQYYESVGRIVDVVRMLEIEVDIALDKNDRIARLRRIIEVRLSQLDDVAGAFENAVTLTYLAPEDAEIRALLDELAERHGVRERQASLLVEIADRHIGKPLRVLLLREAADITCHQLLNTDRAIELYADVLNNAGGDKDNARLAARELDRLLAQTQRPIERCDVLERLADLESDAVVRRRALGEAAIVALDELKDAERAVRCWRLRLDDNPDDSVARDGIVLALEHTDRDEDLIVALTERAERASDTHAARADRVRVAQIWQTQLGSPQKSIASWQTVRELHGRDDESYEALVSLFTNTERWSDLATLVREEAELTSDPKRSKQLRQTLGSIYADRLFEVALALRAYIEAGDWDRAVAVTASVRSQPDLALEIGRELLNRAVLQWTTSAGDSETPEAKATAWVIGELTSTLRQSGAHGDIVDLLLHAANLPFVTVERRTYKRDAAYVCSDYLEDRNRAILLYQEIIDEDAADEIAANCISPLAALLEHSERSSELVDLWEGQAAVRLAAGDNSGAAMLYARAAELSESRLKDIDRALSNYAKAADLGLDAALESLARLYDTRAQFDKSAAVLERFCAAANRETLGERSLWLAQAYVNCGRADSARKCLEHASNNARDLGSVRARLAVLYEEAGLWLELAELLTAEATRSADARERLQLLVRSARVHRDKRADPAAAVPLLEQAGQIDQDDVDLRLELADALSKADSHAPAANVLREQISRYGARRPKERAMVHHALAKELLALGDRNDALEELRAASRIDPARAEVLQLTAKLSMDLNDLDAAEKTFRALLLVLGRGASTSDLSRVEALLDLSEIALRRDDAMRAGEYVESAFEIALETDQEAEAFERAARARGRNDWLLRVLEERLSRATVPTTAAHALFDFARLHSETLGDLSQVAPRIAERAQQIHKQLEKTAVSDDAAWSALSRVYDLLGDESAQARILELRVQAWLDGVVAIDDPKPVLRMGTLKLKSAAKRSEGLKLLERAHEAGATSQQLEDIIGPALDADPSWVEAIDLLEKIARVDGNSQLLSRSLLHRLNTPDATLSQYLETVDLLRSTEDLGALTQILEAAVNGLLGVKFDPATLASARLELADVVLQRGELERALDLREAAASEGLPESTRTQVLLQTATLAAEGQPPHFPERAVRLYQILLADYPSERAYWEPLLELLRKLGDTRQLVAVIESTVPAVNNQDDRSRLRLEQARLLVDSGDTGSAADELRELLDEDPGQTEAAILLAGILERSGRHDELVQLLKVQFDTAQAANDTEGCVNLLGRIAALSEKRGRVDEALEALESALRFQNSNREILERIVELSERLGDTHRAAGALQLLQSGENDPTARLALLDKLYELHVRASDMQAAFQVAKDAFECDPTESSWQERLFDYLEASGDLISLAQYLSRASVASPNDTSLTIRLVEVNRKSGNFAQALEVLDGVLASGVESTSLSCERGRLLLELGRYDEALVELELVDDTTAASAEMLLTALQAATPHDDSDRSRQLGLRQVSLLARVGRDDEMHAVLADLNQRFPGDLAVLELWAQWLSNHGAPDEALGALERLVSSVPDTDVARALEAYLQLCDTSGKSTPALPALERGVHLHPERHDWRQRLLDLYRQAGANRQLAEQLLIQAAFEGDPSAKHGMLLQAAELLLSPDGDLTAARDALEQARAITPDSLEMVILLARLHNAEGNRPEAIALLQATAQSNRGRRSKILAGVYRELSQIMLEDGLRGESLEALLRAFEMDSKNGQLAMQTGRLAMDVENYDVALRVFARIAMMKPVEDDTTGESISHADRADANYCLAYLSYNQGDARKAKILALKALSDNSEHDEARRLVEQLG